MRQLVLKNSCWMAGRKHEVIDALRRLSHFHGDITVQELLRRLQG